MNKELIFKMKGLVLAPTLYVRREKIYISSGIGEKGGERGGWGTLQLERPAICFSLADEEEKPLFH